MPVVAIDSFPVMDRANVISIDDLRGGQMATEHLRDLGHERIGFIYAADDRPSIKNRMDGYNQAMKDADLPICAYSCDALTFEAGYSRALDVLDKKKRPTALICANDEIAAGCLRAARRLGLKVPDDLSVIGFDNIAMSNYTDPALTTISADKEGMGAHAVLRLIDLVKNKGASRIQEILPVELVVRESTGSVPKKR